jgi:hypothetical protein
VYLGRVQAALAIPMLAATAAAAGAWAWTWLRARRLPTKERRSPAIALWMSLPAVLLSLAGAAFMLACFTYGRAPATWQYTTAANERYWDLWGSWFLPALLLLPLGAIVSLLSFLAYARGTAWRSLLAVRAATLTASGLVWYATALNTPSA